MRVPLRWLAEFADVPDAATLAAALTQGGLEVESTLHIGPDLAGVRVGHVLERAQHPNADRLSVCKVDLGGGEPVEIVCGAPNVAAGQKVAVISPGAKLPDGKKLEKAKIRGVVSHGMICSAKELGIAAESDGILVLDASAKVGAPLGEILATGDAVLEIALTPNRGDCASMLGIAREVRAHFGGALRLPPVLPDEEGEPAAAPGKPTTRSTRSRARMASTMTSRPPGSMTTTSTIPTRRTSTALMRFSTSHGATGSPSF